MLKRGGLGETNNLRKLFIILIKKEWGELCLPLDFEIYCLYQSPFFSKVT